MDIPSRLGARPSLALPSIVFNDSEQDRYRTSSRSSSYNSSSSTSSHAIPMSIKGSREPVPPPLPPPKDLADIRTGGNNGQDLAWRFANSHRDSGGLGSSVAPGSSLYGDSRMGKNNEEIDRPTYTKNAKESDRPNYSRSTSSSTTIKSMQPAAGEHGSPRDEGYSSYSTGKGSYRSNFYPDFSGGRSFQSSVHDTFQTDAQAYDKSLLQKLDARGPVDKKTPPRNYSKMSAFSSSASDASPTSRINADHRHPSQLKPLSLPILSGRPGLGFVESPVALGRHGENPLSFAKSTEPHFPRFALQTQFEPRSHSDADSDRSPHPYVRGSGSSSAMSFGDDASSFTSRSRDSYDPRISPDHDAQFQMEETGLRRLRIDEYSGRQEPYSPSSTAGQKRRASSPPAEDGPSLHTVGSASDLFRRRESASRRSPTPRLHSAAGSVSSAASAPRANSYASSTLSITTSSVSSLSSYARSPGGLSPGGLDSSDSSYVPSLNPSPRSCGPRVGHQRHPSTEGRPLLSSHKPSDSLATSKAHGAPKIQGIYMCECCPKKPKKFDCQEDLDAHEQEKQYQCAYCNNRFKNKNEAERHQNSLHLRRHSWSCAALSGYSAAFHESSARPGEADTCGYCGEDFPRSGLSSTSPAGPQVPIPTDRDWDVRIGHLQEMHKFGECNHAKKFFRADHFRQHLKHSHAGTSGKWTNMLENSCMKDEPLPEPIRGPGATGGGRVSRINEEEELYE
ncbi:C2H2 and C2HC zinc finger [Glarea lozoyensis ATCC 20868]|uniref:C2H2 and C2HC zinc finger n=1 Tax=Glarea lozoyensis (strain ATCC 20868 / MF5171) TaxID=1116229 RepID=S3EF60_GLAL2|nr:C2H2 and C2HC zinc finger [Glarea lozoyensis ATCC 20868]EPE36803.1 C2H2 and C2HC zinc finger [Glarea lozoyensis ATCC 20868]